MEDLDYLKNNFLAAVDEVGRGPLAGPVIAGCSFITGENIEEVLQSLRDLGVTDSKKLTDKKRLKIVQALGFEADDLLSQTKFEIAQFKNCNLTVTLAEISPASIDELNILVASLTAMANAFKALGPLEGSGCLLIDGNQKLKQTFPNVQQVTLVKGDSRSVMIGLASIFAKVARDHLMIKMGEKYPGYGLESHAGYPTPSHKEAIATLGVTPIHRKSFRGVKEHL